MLLLLREVRLRLRLLRNRDTVPRICPSHPVLLLQLALALLADFISFRFCLSAKSNRSVAMATLMA
jgi:hypothetical protein